MITLENVTYRYRDDLRPALQNVNLEIKAGESVSIMGANGSGKSTFARLLAGLIKLKQGQLRISNAAGKPIPVGMIFQNPDNQMVAVTVEKELAFSLENLGYPQAEMENLITDNLDKFGITHLRQRLTTELSGGEKQRVALASVMIFEPDILILDEPDSFLDEEGKVVLKNELANIKERHSSMIQIHISQYRDAARGYGRLIVFDRGEVAADGEPGEVLQDGDLCERTGLRFSDTAKKRVAVPVGLESARHDRGRHLSAIEADKVRFAYTGDTYVLRNFSCTFRAREIVGVVGSSGSGKSTLGNLICGLLKPEAGCVTYRNQGGDSVDPQTAPGRVTGVFQQPERQFFLPTCREELTFGPKNLGQQLDPQTIEGLFAMAGLEPETFPTRDPLTLSGGEKRRLAFAAVLSMSPDFVVFDEPTCGLDPEGVGRFILLAQALRDMGLGLIIISHDGQIMRSLADRIIYLREDASNLILSAREFFDNPLYRKVVSSFDQTAEQCG